MPSESPPSDPPTTSTPGRAVPSAGAKNVPTRPSSRTGSRAMPGPMKPRRIRTRSAAAPSTSIASSTSTAPDGPAKPASGALAGSRSSDHRNPNGSAVA